MVFFCEIGQISTFRSTINNHSDHNQLRFYGNFLNFGLLLQFLVMVRLNVHYFYFYFNYFKCYHFIAVINGYIYIVFLSYFYSVF